MIVTTGKHIKIDAACSRYTLSRTAETPGVVRVEERKGGSITLPANEQESEDFIAAYRRAIKEDIEYRKTDTQ